MMAILIDECGVVIVGMCVFFFSLNEEEFSLCRVVQMIGWDIRRKVMLLSSVFKGPYVVE